MTTGKHHSALNLLSEGLLRILQVKQNTDIAEVDKALDLLNTSNPELIGWLHKRLLSCIARNISQGSAPINHSLQHHAEPDRMSKVAEDMLREVLETAAPFQNDKELEGVLHVGQSTMIDGLKKGIAALKLLVKMRGHLGSTQGRLSLKLDHYQSTIEGIVGKLSLGNGPCRPYDQDDVELFKSALPVHAITIQPRGPRLLLPGIPGHQHMMDVDGRLTCGCIVEVAGGSTTVRPDAGSADAVEDTARRIAVLAHHGQRGKYGDMGMPYIVHIDRVVARLKTAELRAVAWLHDVLEDTDVTAPMLFASGIPLHIITAVQLLTRGSEPYQSESYETYITRLIASGNVLALRVKLADLDDHIEGRGSMRPTAAKLKRYEQAREHVSTALKGVQ